MFFSFLLFSCAKENNKGTAVAKIYDKVLYLEEIPPVIYKNKSPEDSSRAIKEYMENWANKELFLAEARKNIDTSKINQLVASYKNDLLKEKYLNKLVEKYLDTLISKDSLESQYQKFKDIYTAREDYAQVYYLVMPKNTKKKYLYQKWFFDQKIEHQDSLFKHTGEFNEMDLSGQKWYSAGELKEKFPVLKRMNNRQIIKKRKKIITTDSLSLYLMFVNEIVRKGQALPLSFVEKDIKQLILSNRKQELEKRIMNEMKEEAIKSRHFIIYSQNKKEK